MAADQKNDLTLPQQDAGLAFRAEMWASNTLLGYWRHLVVLVVVVLVGTLIYGLWSNDVRARQREATARIAVAWAELPQEAEPGAESDEDKAVIRAVADDLSRIGRETKGTARAEAWLKAAELYRRLEEPEQQRAAFVEAATTAKGVLLYTARSGLANLDLEEGKGEEAIATLKELMAQEGMLGQEAALDLAVAYEFLERPADALAVYTQFLTRWPDSPRTELVQERMARLEPGS